MKFFRVLTAARFQDIPLENGSCALMLLGGKYELGIEKMSLA